YSLSACLPQSKREGEGRTQRATGSSVRRIAERSDLALSSCFDRLPEAISRSVQIPQVSFIGDEAVKGILKWPLIVAAAVVVLRVVVEQSGAPNSVSNIISVVALHLVIVPLYFAIRIAKSGLMHPYVTQVKLVALYVVLTRA